MASSWLSSLRSIRSHEHATLQRAKRGNHGDGHDGHDGYAKGLQCLGRHHRRRRRYCCWRHRLRPRRSSCRHPVPWALFSCRTPRSPATYGCTITAHGLLPTPKFPPVVGPATSADADGLTTSANADGPATGRPAPRANAGWKLRPGHASGAADAAFHADDGPSHAAAAGSTEYGAPRRVPDRVPNRAVRPSVRHLRLSRERSNVIGSIARALLSTIKDAEVQVADPGSGLAKSTRKLSRDMSEAPVGIYPDSSASPCLGLSTVRWCGCCGI